MRIVLFKAFVASVLILVILGIVTASAAPSVTVSNSIVGTVTLQGSSRSLAAREIEVTLRLFPIGTGDADLRSGAGAVSSFTATTVDTGSNTVAFEVAGVAPGGYDITIVSPQTLMNVKRNVTLGDGANILDFGTLLEGDCNDDGQVNVLDFSLLATTYLKSSGSAGFDSRADFDMNGLVNALDFSLLAANYLKHSPVDVSGSAVAYKTYGLNFGPYVEEGQDPDSGTVVDETQLRELLAVIEPYTTWVRTFGCTDGLENVGHIAHEFGLKAAVGAWLGKEDTPGGMAANQAQIASLINIAQAGHADLLVVGSEVLLRNDLPEARLIDYIEQVRAAVQGVPVTTGEIYSVLLAHPAIISAVDVLFVNYYPYWEGFQIDRAVYNLNLWHEQMIAAAQGKEVIVSETGWPSGGSTVGSAVASPENASLYFLNFVSWARAMNVKYFYFEAFDEPWKVKKEGPQGAFWGVWDNSGVMKTGMQAVFDGETMESNWDPDIPGGPGSPSIEFTYVPPYGSFSNLNGQVWHVRPAEYRVAVYIRVSGGWWTKPTFASPLTVIQPDGSWTCDITTGGSDQMATDIAAFVVPAAYNPPAMSGGSNLPAELDANAAARVDVMRSP